MKYFLSCFLVFGLVAHAVAADGKTAKEIQVVGQETNRVSQTSAGFALRVLKEAVSWHHLLWCLTRKTKSH